MTEATLMIDVRLTRRVRELEEIVRLMQKEFVIVREWMEVHTAKRHLNPGVSGEGDS